MSTSQKTLVFVVLPILVVMAGAGFWYHINGYQAAEQTANQRLEATAEHAAEVLELRLKRSHAELVSLMLANDLEEYNQYLLTLPNKATQFRQNLARAARGFAEVRPNVESIEYFLTDETLQSEGEGDRFVAVINGEVELEPHNVLAEPWFIEARKEAGKNIQFIDKNKVRVSHLRTVDYDGEVYPIAVGTIIVKLDEELEDFAHVLGDSTSLEVFNADGDSQLTFGKDKTGSKTFTAQADVPLVNGSLRVAQNTNVALSDFRSGEFVFGTALGVLTLGLIIVGVLGTRMVVRDLNNAHLQVAEANAALEARSQELAQSNAALEQSNIELQQFSYIASHDLQAPLRSISGFAKYLYDEYHGKIDQEADEYITRIINASNTMKKLIDDLLTFTRVDSRAAPFRKTNLSVVFQEAMSQLNADVQAANGVVTRDEMPIVTGDASQLTQVFQHVLSNAVKFVDNGSPKVHVAAERLADGWKISVKDGGIGIDSKHHQRIFEIFRRLHTQAKYPGSGVGLAVCRRIIHRHGGKIWVESELGQGSTFHFTIPDLEESVEKQLAQSPSTTQPETAPSALGA